MKGSRETGEGRTPRSGEMGPLPGPGGVRKVRKAAGKSIRFSGFLTRSGFRFSGLAQSRTRPKGFLRLPVQETVEDHTPTSTPRPLLPALLCERALSTGGHEGCVMPCPLVDTLRVKEMSLYCAQAVLYSGTLSGVNKDLASMELNKAPSSRSLRPTLPSSRGMQPAGVSRKPHQPSALRNMQQPCQSDSSADWPGAFPGDPTLNPSVGASISLSTHRDMVTQA